MTILMLFTGKDKLLLFCILIIIQNLCSCQNTTDAQISKNIKESKKNGFFIKEFAFLNSTDKNIAVEEAWVENIWFNSNGSNSKIKGKGCQFCFKLKQTQNLRYKEINYLDWEMKFMQDQEFESRTYVGMVHGIYQLSFYSLNIPDTIKLDLIMVKDTNSTLKKTKVGTLMFKAK